MSKRRGLEGVEMIWHGSQSDPELKYNGVVANYRTVEDYLYEDFKEELEEKGLKVKELSDDDRGFNEWLKENFYKVQDIFQQIDLYNIL